MHEHKWMFFATAPLFLWDLGLGDDFAAPPEGSGHDLKDYDALPKPPAFLD